MIAGCREAPPKPVDLVWETGDGYRFARLDVGDGGGAGFTRLEPADTRIRFHNPLSDATIASNRLYEIGSGVALGDVDGDGWVDIYLCGLEGPNVLYRNRGNWTFEDVTEAAGVAGGDQFSTGAVLADIDGNGALDLLVTSLGGGTRLFLNDGQGRFTEATGSGLFRRFGATTMALADVDGDGDLDLYVVNYRTDTLFDFPRGLNVGYRQQPDGSQVAEPRDRLETLIRPDGGIQIVEKGEPDVLYLNQGGGRFRAMNWDVGLFLDEEGRRLPAAPLDWGLAAMFRDLNGDSLPDLYVCNDFAYWPDRVWLNQEGQRFRAAPRHAFRCFSLSSMAVDVADINRDGHDDLFVADMLSPKRESRAWQRPGMLDDVIDWPHEDPDFRPEVARNTLHLARGDGTYAEIAQYAGLAATDWTWGVAFLDVDLDGWEDLLVTTGSNHDIQDADMQARVAQYGGGRTHANRMNYLKDLPRRPTPGVALRNQRDLTFADASARWGFDDVGFANGLALADLDNDGDLDVVVNCLQEPARVYRNNSPAPRLAVRLRGEGKNTRGIGARITVTGGPVTQSQEMIAGGRYLSGDDAMRVFAAGEARELDIEVVWRGGRRSVVRGARANHVYEIAEEGAAPVVESPAGTLEPLFEDVTAGLNHTHVDAVYDDFARQPLLPRKLSTLGPGIAWADVDGDGNDDLIIGGGREGGAAVFRHRARGGFEEWTEAALPGENIRDQTGLLGWRGTDGVMRLVIGESNWQEADRNAPAFRVFAMGAGPNPGEAVMRGDDAPSLAARDVVTGPLAMGDVDGDGRLELFIGGRAIAGRFPEAAASRLLGHDEGGFRVVRRFEGLGLVSGAVFADLNGDAAPDLALACDWGPVRLFRNEGGQLVEWNAPLRWPERAGREPRAEAIHQLTGWWNGIAAGDFDGDGRLDLVVSNWGRNWRTDQPPGMELPVHVYYGDFVGNGVVQTLVASRDPFLDRVTPWREWSAVCAAIPSVAGRVPDQHAYGGATVKTVLGDRAGIARELVANTFDSMILLNRGDHFEPRALPAEAQFAAAFGVSVADFDGDGNEDIFLAQNFFGVDAETSRQDAGTGLLLLGDGSGGFRALRPLEAGVAIYGEQRGSAVTDFDGDGRVDLAVAQQGGRTRLFRNLRARPGVRVSVRGPEGNAAGVGAVLRLRSAGRWGPARQVSLGTGYWSQDTARPVLAAPGEPETIEVRWPWGETRQYSWPEGAREIEVSSEGVGSPAGERG